MRSCKGSSDLGGLRRPEGGEERVETGAEYEEEALAERELRAGRRGGVEDEGEEGTSPCESRRAVSVNEDRLGC